MPGRSLSFPYARAATFFMKSSPFMRSTNPRKGPTKENDHATVL